MGKQLVVLLDGFIVLAVVWYFALRDYVTIFQFFAALFILLIAIVSWVHITKKKEQERADEAARIANEIATQQQVRDFQLAAEQEARHAELVAEHEARRPICKHCGKKTDSVFSHRRVDGAPDMRYHDNPLLCNRCFKPYSPIRPWKIAKNESSQ